MKNPSYFDSWDFFFRFVAFETMIFIKCQQYAIRTIFNHPHLLYTYYCKR